MKNKIVNVWPNNSYGGSTGCPPIHVSKINVEMSIQNSICEIGYIVVLLEFCENERGSVNKMKIAENIATTPPNLFGIDRRIAYAHRKYHSGLI